MVKYCQNYNIKQVKHKQKKVKKSKLSTTKHKRVDTDTPGDHNTRILTGLNIDEWGYKLLQRTNNTKSTTVARSVVKCIGKIDFTSHMVQM